VASPGELFSKLGLSFVQAYGDGKERDVTGVMIDIGFDISKMSEGEVTASWGMLVADRDASDAGYNIPVVLSSIGEDGHILFDGKRDNDINGTFYIAQAPSGPIQPDQPDQPVKNSGGGCNAGLGAFAFVLWASTKKITRTS
jgi:hypothetical protein